MTTLRLLTKLVASLSLVLVPIAGFNACSPQEREFGSGGSGGSSSGGMPCNADSECGANSWCQSFACVNGTCSVTFTPMGTAVSTQALGDCQTNVCDGNGYIVNVADLADPVNDGNPCTLDACVGAETQHGFLASGTSCNGSFFCDGFGFCVECLDESQCVSGICYKNACTTAECSDMAMNGDETDVDCGGSLCSPCPTGLKCAANYDCKSQVCESGTCAAPTCTDSVLNGLETSIDCGGPECSPCPTSSACNVGLDCKSNVCARNVCLEPACDDMVTNGGESDVDCGGLCMKCSLGQGCYGNKDCLSNQCCLGDPNMPGYCESYGAPCMLVLRSETKK